MMMNSTVCARNLDPIYAVTYFIKYAKNSWRDSKLVFTNRKKIIIFKLFENIFCLLNCCCLAFFFLPQKTETEFRII